MGAIHVHEFVSLDGVIDTPSRIGLLEPEERSGSASYRRYGPGSVERLHRILSYHELGLPEERFELFGDFDFDGYAPVAKERWGETEAYKEARRRTAGYRAADWRAIRAEAGDIEAGLATVLSAGEPADGERAIDLAERHRAHISRWFYQCSPEAHRRLGELYVADWRFTKPFEEIAAGLAEFFRDAIVANAERLEES
jgi:hypothetical protein